MQAGMPATSNDAESTGWAALETGSAWIDLPDLMCIRLSGADVTDWLQGQVTQDLLGTATGDTSALCVCKATGQIEAVGVARNDGNAWTLSLHGGEALLKRIETMVFLEEVEVESVIRGGFSVQGRMALPIGTAVPNDRTGRGGFDCFEAPHPTSLQLPPAVYDAATLETGTPLFDVDIGARTLPAELGERFLHKHVSFNKGCYVGQEVLMRLHSRGHTNRTWVVLTCEALPTPGSVRSPSGEAAGAITRTAMSPRFGHLAAAFVKNEYAATGTEVIAESSDGPVTARVHARPLLAGP
jgi:folate-binding protein YgfZ